MPEHGKIVSSSHTNTFMDFKQIVFKDDKRFCVDESDNINSYVKHRGGSVITLRWMNRQMAGGGAKILGVIPSFSNLVIIDFEGKCNNLKYLDDLQTILIL